MLYYTVSSSFPKFSQSLMKGSSRERNLMDIFVTALIFTLKSVLWAVFFLAFTWGVFSMMIFGYYAAKLGIRKTVTYTVTLGVVVLDELDKEIAKKKN